MAFLSLTRGNTHVLNQNDFNEGYGVESPFSYSTTRSTWARISWQRRLPAQARDAEPYRCLVYSWNCSSACLARLRDTRIVSRSPFLVSPSRVILGFRALPLSASLKSSASAGGNISFACFMRSRVSPLRSLPLPASRYSRLLFRIPAIRFHNQVQPLARFSLKE